MDWLRRMFKKHREAAAAVSGPKTVPLPTTPEEPLSSQIDASKITTGTITASQLYVSNYVGQSGETLGQTNRKLNSPEMVQTMQSICDHRWTKGHDYCQAGCGLSYLEWREQVLSCDHYPSPLNYACVKCHCAVELIWQLGEQKAEESPELQAERRKKVEELDQEAHRESYTIPEL